MFEWVYQIGQPLECSYSISHCLKSLVIKSNFDTQTTYKKIRSILEIAKSKRLSYVESLKVISYRQPQKNELYVVVRCDINYVRFKNNVVTRL